MPRYLSSIMEIQLPTPKNGRIILTGSRLWEDWGMINASLAYSYRALSEVYNSDDVILVHGNCPTGADKIGNDIWVSHGLPVERYPADWDTHGKSAGPMRNNYMISLGADVVLGFPLGESRGTRGCMKAAAEHGLKVVDCTTVDWKAFS